MTSDMKWVNVFVSCCVADEHQFVLVTKWTYTSSITNQQKSPIKTLRVSIKIMRTIFKAFVVVSLLLT